jgi:glycosyltransferase involved in cell wall biosynthesis
LKVLFLARLYKPHVGGVEKHLEKINGILSKKHDITIITEQHDQSLPEKEIYSEGVVYRIPLGSSEKYKKFVIWKWFLSNLWLIREADVIHVHDVFFWILPFRLFFPNKKFFITFHGYEGSGVPGVRQVIWHKIGEWGSLGNICIGDFHRKWYKTNPDIVSYGAVDIEKDIQVKKKNRIMYLGRLDQDTGILDYLKAASLLGAQIDIYGDGPQIPQAVEYSRQTKLKASFLGFVPQASAFISKYPLVFTSRYLGILEALVAKTHIIAHYDSEIKLDYLSLAPFADFIDICSNGQEIYAAAKKIIDNPKKYQSRLTQGYNWARLQTWQKMVNHYEKLWQKNP